MAEDRVNDFFGVAALAENLRAFVGVLFRRVMFGIGPAFVVEIVKQARQAPGAFVATELLGVSANAGFNGQGMFSQAFALCVFAEQIPCVVSIRHLFLGNHINATASGVVGGLGAEREVFWPGIAGRRETDYKTAIRNT